MIVGFTSAMFWARRSMSGSAYATVAPRPSGRNSPATRSKMCESGSHERKMSSSDRSMTWFDGLVVEQHVARG